MNVARWSAALASSSSQETPLDYNSFAFLRLWRVWIPVVSRYESFGRTRDVERFNPRPHVAGDSRPAKVFAGQALRWRFREPRPRAKRDAIVW